MVPTEPKPKTIAVVSGGLDSIVMLYQLVADGHEVEVVSFDYGQKHRKELRSAQLLTSILKVPWLKIDVSALGASLASALTRPEAPVPDGHYAEDSMKATIVPNRNAIMLSIAWGIAVSHHANYVATAVHSGDHFIYPDCRPEFISRFNATMQIANDGMMEPFVRMYTPFMHSTKAHIVKIGSMLHVPFDRTWSCVTGDTTVRTLAGDKPIVDVKEGDWVWGWNDEGWWQPAHVHATMRQGVKRVYEVVLDDKVGHRSSFRCTADHLLMLRDGTYAPLNDVRVGVSLMPASIYTQTGRVPYRTINLFNDWHDSPVYAHQIVADFFGIEGDVIHHGEGGVSNNNPSNLEGMRLGAHTRLHVAGSLQPAYANGARSAAVRAHWKALTADERTARGHNISAGKLNHKIVSITDVGEAETYDIETSTGNFAVGAGIFVHNCYKGDAIHCGACGTCIERREAFVLADVSDPTGYATLPPIPMQHPGDLPVGDA